MKFGTPLAQQAQPFTPGQIDYLGTFNYANGLAVGAFAVTFTALHSYTMIGALCTTNTSSPYCAVLTNNSAAGGALAPQFGASYDQSQTLFPVRPFRTNVPCACNSGDSLTLNTIFAANNLSGSIALYGFTNTTPPPMRADGRCHPLGQLSNGSGLAAGNGPAVVLGAPNAPLRYLVKSIQLDCETSGTQISVQGTIGGSLRSLANLRCGASSAMNLVTEPEGGIILDMGTQIQLSGAGNPTGQCLVIADLVA